MTKTKEEQKAYDAARNKLPHRIAMRKKYRIESEKGRENYRAFKRRQSEKFKEKEIAGGKLRHAVRTGKIKKQPCERCGITVRVQGHHEDYSKPLDVMWLCVKHHHERHKEINNVD